MSQPKRIDAWTVPSPARLCCIAFLAAGAGFGLSLAGGEIARRHDTSSGGKSSVLMTAAASADTTKHPTQPRDSIAARRPLPTPR